MLNDNDMEALVARIDKLTPPEKLRLAAELLDNKRLDIAYTIADQAVKLMGAYLTMRSAKR